MSKMRLPTYRKPPLAESPTKLRPSRILRSSLRSIQTPSDSVTKSLMATSSLWDLEEPHMRPEDQSISCELRALAKMVEHQFSEAGNTDFPVTACANRSPVFERGRFYDEYSARRNERLKRKKCGETREDSRRSVVRGLGVAIESGKKRDSKKYESLRKSVPANFSIGETKIPRYSLRSSTRVKENMKPSIPLNAAKYVSDGNHKRVQKP